jgi:tRNA-uridine 2-sulfurtransferase
VVHIDGRVLGRHEGIIRYTVGQRRGLGLALREALYVVRLDADAARVVVGPREALATHTVQLRDMNWLGDLAWDDLDGVAVDVAVRVRSTRQPRPAVLWRRAEAATVTFASGEEGVAPGQACVIYEDVGARARVLGGGTIHATSGFGDGPARAADVAA